MPTTLTQLFSTKDTDGLRALLHQQPQLANTGITYLDQGCGPLAHPLHRLCDAVFVNALTDLEAVEMARILLEFGANVNGNYAEDGSTPLIAAASLLCQELGIYYIDQGADVFLVERNGEATPLHWACYCGLDKLTQKLADAGANLNQHEAKFNCTPTEWALHALMEKPQHAKEEQLECIKVMLKAGADQSLFAERFKIYLHQLAKGDAELKQLVSN